MKPITKIVSMKLANCFIAATLLFALCSKTADAGSTKKERHLYVSHFENVLGTSMDLKIAAASEDNASLAETAAKNEIGRLGSILSAYDPSSEFSAWLKTSGQPVHVSPELFEVLNLFDEWRISTNGALDASAEVVTKLWKASAAKNRVPTQEELNEAVAGVKQQHWKLDPVAHTATHLSNAPLMLNSFAKSYIIKHAAAAAMALNGVKAIVVNIGGDLVVSGNMVEPVAISDPKDNAENSAPIDNLLIGNKAVATSGNYRRGEMIGGHWYSHIVDPRTGQPSDNIISATVVAPNATDAGALATAFNVLSPAESVMLAAGYPGIEYLIITKEGQRIESKGWAALKAPAIKQPQPAKDVYNGAGNRSDAYELVVNLEINLQQQSFAKRPYVAVWIEDENHAPVRTIALWHERDKYLDELKSWFLKYRGRYSSDQSFLGASVSSATRSAGKYTVKWDGKDDNGNVVKPGTYTIKIEAAREHGTYQLMRQVVECNTTPQQFNLPGNVEIASASVEYRKKSE